MSILIQHTYLLNKAAGLSLVLMLSLFTQTSFALKVYADRDTVAINDTLRITVETNSGEDPSKVDLNQIAQHFVIERQSSQSSFSMVNGRTESIKQLILTAKPRRVGELTIPSLAIGRDKSRPLTLTVTQAVQAPSAIQDQSVFVEAEVTDSEVYLGESLEYVYRIYYTSDLSNAQLDELKLENANLTQLEGTGFSRMINGQRYRVAEQRYRITPNKLGSYTIPSLRLTAFVPDGNTARQPSRFGFDDFFARNRVSGKNIKLGSDPVTFSVVSVPQSAVAQNALVAKGLQIQEQWSSNIHDAEIGEPITRTITLIAHGVDKSQIAPVEVSALDGLNIYPEQAIYNQQESANGVVSDYRQSFAYIPTRAGEFTTEEIRIPWFNTDTEQMDVANIPSKSFKVLASTTAPASNPKSQVSPATLPQVGLSESETVADLSSPTSNGLLPSPKGDSSSGVWKFIALISLLLWLVTVCLLGLILLAPHKLATTMPYLVKRLSLVGGSTNNGVIDNPVGRPLTLVSNLDPKLADTTLKRLLHHCKNSDRQQVYQALVSLIHAWYASLPPSYKTTQKSTQNSTVLLSMLVDLLAEEDLLPIVAEMTWLEESLFSMDRTLTSQQDWNADTLARLAKLTHKALSKLIKLNEKPQTMTQLPPLYAQQ